jgi:hypothetical protein
MAPSRALDEIASPTREDCSVVNLFGVHFLEIAIYLTI